MPRRKRRAAIDSPVPTVAGVLSRPEGELKKQSRYGSDPWKPGEIPTRTGSLRPITGRLDEKPAAYGQFMCVRKPDSSGRGKPDDKGNP